MDRIRWGHRVSSPAIITGEMILLIKLARPILHTHVNETIIPSTESQTRQTNRKKFMWNMGKTHLVYYTIHSMDKMKLNWRISWTTRGQKLLVQQWAAEQFSQEKMEDVVTRQKGRLSRRIHTEVSRHRWRYCGGGILMDGWMDAWLRAI